MKDKFMKHDQEQAERLERLKHFAWVCRLRKQDMREAEAQQRRDTRLSCMSPHGTIPDRAARRLAQAVIKHGTTDIKETYEPE